MGPNFSSGMTHFGRLTFVFSPHESGGSGSSTETMRTKPFSSADLPMDPEGRMYHLKVNLEEISSNILVVGDPGRAKAIGEEFFEKDSIETDVEHRGLRTVTGISKSTDQRVTVCTHQMGTGSTEIVINELMLLASVDPKTRTLKPRDEATDLKIIRIGTSGSLRPEVPIGSLIVTKLSVGLDNSALFTEADIPEDLIELERRLAEEINSRISEGSRFKGRVLPYVSVPDPAISDLLLSIAKEKGYSACGGITASNSGFFAAQGRDVLYSRPTVPDIDRVLYSLGEVYDGLKFLNMEMEASLIHHLASGNGHKAGAICIGIANRALDTFDSNYQEHVGHATEVALEALSRA